MDQMSIVLALDNDSANMLEHLAPHKSMLDPNSPRTMSDNARIPKPVASTIANWIHTPETSVVTQHQTQFMKALAV
jgi:hypothetical protein